MQTMENAVKYLQSTTRDFDPDPCRIGFFLKNAKELMQKALKFYCEDKAKWVKGYDEIVEWLSNSEYKGLLIIGDCGTGKSLICTKIIPTIMISRLDFKPATYSAYSLNRDSESIIAGRARVLVIDDIGVESEQVNYGNRAMVFNEIVDQAERLGQILILTTNLSKEQLISKYGTRTVDRLIALTKMVVIKGKSLRTK